MKHHAVSFAIVVTCLRYCVWVSSWQLRLPGRHGEARRAEVSREMVVSDNGTVLISTANLCD